MPSSVKYERKKLKGGNLILSDNIFSGDSSGRLCPHLLRYGLGLNGRHLGRLFRGGLLGGGLGLTGGLLGGDLLGGGLLGGSFLGGSLGGEGKKEGGGRVRTREHDGQVRGQQVILQARNREGERASDIALSMRGKLVEDEVVT